MGARKACARCWRLQWTLVRVSSVVFGMFVNKSLCAFCCSEILRVLMDTINREVK